VIPVDGNTVKGENRGKRGADAFSPDGRIGAPILFFLFSRLPPVPNARKCYTDRKMRLSLLVLLALSSSALVPLLPTHAQDKAIDLDNVYRDETHCLVAPESRGVADKPISCYCRDAIAEARYVWQTYLATGKDRNLNGIYLTLELNAGQKCGEGFNVLDAIQSQWNGPEVTRTYPPDRTIEQLKPNQDGFRDVEYAVLLTFRDSRGRVTRVVNFIARDLLPPDFKKYSCPPSAVCPK
jgi:hypothetical protein